jgi:hypothetical protein
LATTIEITIASETYRFNFPSISTYTDFVGVSSNTNIVNDEFALTEDANVISFPTEITRDLVIVGDLTTTNFEVNGEVNIDTQTYFDTIVIRLPTGFSGDAIFLGLRELQ